MKWTKISAIIGTVLLVVALTLKLAGYGKVEAIDPNEAKRGEIKFIEPPPEPNEPIKLEIWTCNNPDCDRSFSKMGELLLHHCVITGPNEPLANWYDRGTFVITPEPNESSMRYSFPIPTWPDYIELEKDLWIDCIDGPRDPNDYYIITKGTKIYFKDD